MYVPFLDVVLGRSYVQHAEMRVSFPYYLGPGTWTVLHTVAGASRQDDGLVEGCKQIMANLTRIYPCPYCRHHMCAYVFMNGETELYPLEWTLLGNEQAGVIGSTIHSKVATVKDSKDLNLFVWKLHNAVNSSIARQEDWFTVQANAMYTSRFYPSIDGVLSLASALKQSVIEKVKIESMYKILNPKIKLKMLKAELLQELKKEAPDFSAIEEAAKPIIRDLEDCLAQCHTLDGFVYNPMKREMNPSFTPEEEEYARGGLFALV